MDFDFLIQDKRISSTQDKVIKVDSQNVLDIFTYQGSTGAQGSDGSQGNQGFQGVPGINGIQGNVGFQGAQGATGNQGAQGSTTSGTQGTVGFQGFQGAQGFQGFQGNSNSGSVGSPGAQGSQGDVGGDATTYLQLNDTPANFSDTYNALVINDAGTAIIHNSIRARISVGREVTGNYSISYLGTGAITNGDYLFNSSNVANNADMSFFFGSPALSMNNNNSFIIGSAGLGNAERIVQSNALMSSKPEISGVFSDVGLDGLNASIVSGTNNQFNAGFEFRTDIQVLNGSKYNTLFFSIDSGVLNNSIGCSVFGNTGYFNLNNSSYICAFNSDIGSVSSTYSVFLSCERTNASSLVGTRNFYVNSVPTNYSTVIDNTFFENTENDFSQITGGSNLCGINGRFDVTATSSSYLYNCFSFDCTFVVSDSAGTNSSTNCYSGSNTSQSNFDRTNTNCAIICMGFKPQISIGGIGSGEESYMVNCNNSIIMASVGAFPEDQNSNRLEYSDQCCILSSPGSRIYGTTSNSSIISSDRASLNYTGGTFGQSIILSIRSNQTSLDTLIGSPNGIAANHCALMGNDSTLSGTATFTSSTAESLSTQQLIYTSINVVSDQRLKKDIERLEKDPAILDKIDKINIYNFNFDFDHPNHPPRTGFLAQEIQKVFPQAVDSDNFVDKNAIRTSQTSPWITPDQDLIPNQNHIKTDPEDPLRGSYKIREDPNWLGLSHQQFSFIAWEAIQVLTERNIQMSLMLEEMEELLNKF